MDQQENQQSPVEDLTVTEEQAADVKGGIETPFYLNLQTVEGDSTAAGGPRYGGYNLKTNVKI